MGLVHKFLISSSAHRSPLVLYASGTARRHYPLRTNRSVNSGSGGIVLVITFQWKASWLSASFRGRFEDFARKIRIARRGGVFGYLEYGGETQSFVKNLAKRRSVFPRLAARRKVRCWRWPRGTRVSTARSSMPSVPQEFIAGHPALRAARIQSRWSSLPCPKRQNVLDSAPAGAAILSSDRPQSSIGTGPAGVLRNRVGCKSSRESRAPSRRPQE